MVKLLQIFCHVFKDFLHCDVDFFHDTFVDISDDLLNQLELLKQFATCIEHIFRKYIFLSVHPKIRKTFLCRIKDFCKVAKTSLLVKDFIRFRKLLSIFAGGADRFETLAKPFDLVQKPFARSLSILTIQIILLILSLL